MMGSVIVVLQERKYKFQVRTEFQWERKGVTPSLSVVHEHLSVNISDSGETFLRILCIVEFVGFMQGFVVKCIIFKFVTSFPRFKVVVMIFI